MTYRNAGSALDNGSQVQITLGSNIQPGDIITVGAMFVGAGHVTSSTGLTVTSTNGGTFTDLSAWQANGSRAGQVFRRVAIAGDASSTITLATNGLSTGRCVALYDARSGLDTVTAPVAVVNIQLGSSTDLPFPAATPTSGWTGGDVVRMGFGNASSGGQPTIGAGSSGLTLRAQGTTTSSSGTNAAGAVFETTFPDDTAVALATATASLAVSNRILVTVLYLEAGVDQPIANAGPNQQVAAGTTVQLAGSGSGGSGGPYPGTWRKISGTQAVTFEPNATTLAATFDTTASLSDTIVLGLIVEDDDGVESVEDTVTIEVVGVENTAIPISDNTTTGWTKDPTGAPSFASLLADFDTDTLMFYTDPAGTVVAELSLSELPEATAGDTVQFGYKTSMFGFSTTGATFIVKQGASTVIASRSDDWTAEETIQAYIIELTDAQIGSVSAWDGLRLRWEFEGTA